MLSHIGWSGCLGLLGSLIPLVASVVGGDRGSDAELVRAVLKGDQTSYRVIVERYQGRVHAVIYGMVRNREDARDLTQETFVRAYQNLSRFRIESGFYTWVYRIAMNTTIDHIRRQKKRAHEAFEDGVATRETGGVMSDGAHMDSPGKSLERKRLHGRLLAALDELPEDQRQVIVLREVDGLSYKEISEVLEVPEGTVMSRLFYARRKLQNALSEERA